MVASAQEHATATVLVTRPGARGRKGGLRRLAAMVRTLTLLVALAPPALVWAQEPTLDNGTIRAQKQRYQQRNYPRQGQYGGSNSAPATTGPAGSRDAATGSRVPAPAIRSDRARALESWKPDIAAYSLRHYGEAEWRLQPTCLVLHYTAGSAFPWNLVQSSSFEGERPGLASHFVVQESVVWQILPPEVRSRGAYGINHRAINIEMVGLDATDLAGRASTLETCARLVAWLVDRYRIPLSKIYSHQQVSRMDRRLVPEVLDLVNSEPYGKTDPGEANMARLKSRVAALVGR